MHAISVGGTSTGEHNGEDVIDGVIREGIISATLSPNTNCTFDLVGSATETPVEGNLEPNPCPNGRSGTWSLQRER